MRSATIGALCLLLTGCTGPPGPARTATPPAAPAVMLPAPPRPPGALTGSEFLAATEDATYPERQAAAVRELVAGNLPASLRPLAPIVLTDGRDTLTVRVTRDYLAIGSDLDAVRIPLSLPSARAVAAAFRMLLPTPRLVDAIYDQADLRLAPRPMHPGDEMRSNDYYRQHHRTIEAQRAGRATDGLIAGHKKDVVLTTQLRDRPDRVAIYGWHRGTGDPIQPLSLWHTAGYEDYSHGLRLVHPVGLLDGARVRLDSLTGHPVWGPLLTDEPELDMEAMSWSGARGTSAAPSLHTSSVRISSSRHLTSGEVDMTHLVLGGTGTVGSEVVRQLRERGEAVRVVTRSEEKAAELPDGVEGVVGDLTEPGTYGDIFGDLDTLFLLNAVAMTETHEGLAALNEAKRAGAKRIVYLSVQQADSGRHIPHFASKVAIEDALKESGVAHTVLRPSNFFQNDYWFREGMTEHGVYAQPLGAVGVSRVDVGDIGEAAANALTSDEFEGGTYTLGGPDALTAEDCARIWGEALGRDLGTVDDPAAWAEMARGSMPDWMIWDFESMYRMFGERGLVASDAELRETERIVGHSPRTFESWVAEVAPGWK